MASKPLRLSSERLHPQRKTPDRESVHLALGILTQAVRDLVSPQKKHEKDWEVWQIESKMWFSSQENYPGSFKWVCDIIGTEPEALRRWAQNLAKLERRQLRASILSLVRLTYLQAGNRSRPESKLAARNKLEARRPKAEAH